MSTTQCPTTRGTEGRYNTTKVPNDLQDLNFYDRTMRGYHVGQMPLAMFKKEFMNPGRKKCPPKFSEIDFSGVLKVLKKGGEAAMYPILVSFPSGHKL